MYEVLLEEFKAKVETAITSIVEDKGTTINGFFNEKVIHLHDLVECEALVVTYVGLNKVFDSNGYNYNFDCLCADELVMIADMLRNTYNTK